MKFFFFHELCAGQSQSFSRSRGRHSAKRLKPTTMVPLAVSKVDYLDTTFVNTPIASWHVVLTACNMWLKNNKYTNSNSFDIFTTNEQIQKIITKKNLYNFGEIYLHINIHIYIYNPNPKLTKKKTKNPQQFVYVKKSPFLYGGIQPPHRFPTLWRWWWKASGFVVRAIDLPRSSKRG